MTINAGLTLASVGPVVAGLVTSGIRSPKVRKLPPNMKLYRFANADYPKLSWPLGPWWFGRQAFNQIVQQEIKDPDFGLGWAARKHLAIRQCWSKANGLVEATVSEEIFVFAGRGTTKYKELLPNGMQITWVAPSNVEQLFLPNICTRAGFTAEGKRALSIYRSATVESYQLY